MIELLAAILVGVFVATIASLLVPPDRPLTDRLRPYTQYSRSQLGAEVEIAKALPTKTSKSVTSLVTSPVRSVAGQVVEGALDVASDQSELTRRLRRAGFADGSPDLYRVWQMRCGAAGFILFALIFGWMGSRTDRSIFVWAVVGAALGFAGGILSFRAFLERRAESRAKRIKLEAYSIASLLAVVCRTGTGPVVALRTVGGRASGELSSDIARGFQWLAGGSSTREALDRLAAESPSSAAGRIFRLLSVASETGMDPAPTLRQLAEELRKERREELDQIATRRRTAMLIPTMVFMLPVIALYALAPGPSVLLGL